MNAKQTAFLATHAAALPAAVTAPGLSAMIEALPDGRAKALADHETHATLFDGEGRAIATLSRPRVIGADKLYYLALSDGRTVAAFPSCPTVKRCLEAVYSYAASRLPADSDPAEELDSYRASFADNWTQAEAGIYLNFRAAALTRCARWARRIALAWEATGSPTPRAIGQEAPDCLCLECARPFTMGPHDVQICPACYPEERAEALAREACKLEDSADWDRSSGPRFYLSAAEKFERAAKLYRESGYPTRAEHCELRAQFARDNAPAPRPMAERAGLGDAIRRGMAPDVTPAPFFGYPLAPTRAAPAPLWPVQPRRAFADLARVMGGR